MGCVGASSAPQPTAVTLKCPLTHGGLPTFHSALFVRVKAPSTPLCWAWLPLEKLKWEKATGDFSFIKMQVLRHSEHTLKTALISKNPELVSLYEKFNAGEQRLMNEAFQLSSSLFGPISVHSRSDWITSHPEAPQDFEQFFTDRYRNKPCPEKHIIYIQSIGSLGNTRVISEEYIKWLKGYCEAFFYGLTVKFLEPVSVSATRCAFRVNEHTQNLQIHAGHILAFLKKKKPQDAFCIVGITMIDLYPRDSWNFVFGQASLTDGVGIFSFARYGKDFYSTRYEGTVKQPQRTSSSDYSIFDNYYNPEITSILLWRSCKALLRWIDDEPSHASRATPRNSSVHVNLPKPVEAFKDWREWVVKCIAVLEK